jgi:WD40 repeat protein
LDNKYLATGSRDKKINIYSVENGQKLTTLHGHDAAICCLSSVVDVNQRVYLASGSDHKCCSLILWDTRNLSTVSKVQCHSAAVTSVLDLEDGYHLLTGSYDKKINLFNFVKGQIVHSLDSNKTSVTRMLMNADKLRLITSGLDCGLTVWKINRRNNVNFDDNLAC